MCRQVGLEGPDAPFEYGPQDVSSTATRIVAPTKMLSAKGDTFSRASPFSITPMVRAPMIAFQTLPRPPNKLAPPMMTPAIALSKVTGSSARVALPPSMLPAVSTAPMPAARPLIM